MSQQCGQCPALRQQVAALTGEVNRLNRVVAWLQGRLGWLRGAVIATKAWINGELERPTMPARNLAAATAMRLDDTITELDRG